MKILQAIWCLVPAIPIWLFYLLPFWAMGLIKHAPRHGNGWVIEFYADRKWRWWAALWKGWAGHSMPFAIVLRQPASRMIRRHELRHCQQWMWLGVLFPVVYGALLLTHGYRNHPLEEDANAYAWSRDDTD